MILWEILTWLLFGLLVGFIANLVDPHKDDGGITGYIIVGVLGSILGGWLAQVTGLRSGGNNDFNLSSLITSIIGSLIILFIYRFLRGNSNNNTR
jgi:uncharacterized membrane protein YeaQ/YmgE (transglycosylase-associated protein family)